MDALYLSEALQDGLQLEDTAFGDITLRHYTLGDLVLPSGKVVACDPGVFPETLPFTLQLPPGRYPVIVSVATIADIDEHRIAYAMLKLNEHIPVRWEMATTEKQDIKTLEDGEVFCYPVDTGTGCFMDAQVGQLLEQRRSKGEDFADQLFDTLERHPILFVLVRGASTIIDEATEANVIIFESGWGDGCYASYWGYDAENKLACLVTDFAVLDHPDASQEDSAASSD